MSLPSDRVLLLNIAKPSHLLSIAPDGSDIKVLVEDLGVAPDGIAIDPVRKHIFWTYMGDTHDGGDFGANDGSIERVDFDGGNRTVIIPKGKTFTPKQMKCDAGNGHIYWCDREGMRVWRANLDGSEQKILVETGSSEEDRLDRSRHCVGVALDLVNGYLYWTQKGKPNGNEGRIFRASLDLPEGMDPAARSDVELLFSALPEPIDLEWSGKTGFLYWTDRGDPPEGNTLNRADLRGTGPYVHECLIGGLQEGIGLALDEAGQRAFVGDLGGFVRVVALDGDDSGQVIFSGHGPLTGLTYLAHA
ncbi:hypothetical protein [Novosphingobium terrae]|uniref:hypothetical protein n=1 Tax=Novosphingobium terrae TaxID=2726189 RepID=UPI00197CFABA|nr:hypothetical protein [Novosphingobium terrae]